MLAITDFALANHKDFRRRGIWITFRHRKGRAIMIETDEGERQPASRAEGPPAARRFLALDGVRGVAAAMVALMHATWVFPNAILAVDLFFMLSGFVLAHGYGDRLGTWAERRRFAIARLIRLYPLYLTGCLIALPVAIGMAIYGWDYFTPGVVVLATLTAPLFILLPYDDFTIPLNPPGWSLTFELIANLLFLFVGARLSRAMPIMIVSAGLLMWGIAAYTGGTTGWQSFWGAFPRTFFSFFTGVLLYRLWRDRPRLPRPAISVIVLLMTVALVCMLEPARNGLYLAAVVFLINPLIIWLGASCDVEGRAARACKYLGDMSYGVYVLHAPFIMWVESLHFLAVGGNVATYVQQGSTAAVSLALTLAAAHHLTRRLDIPVRRKLAARLLGPRRAPASLATPAKR